jgi:hypothetical protein
MKNAFYLTFAMFLGLFVLVNMATAAPSPITVTIHNGSNVLGIPGLGVANQRGDISSSCPGFNLVKIKSASSSCVYGAGDNYFIILDRTPGAVGECDPKVPFRSTFDILGSSYFARGDRDCTFTMTPSSDTFDVKLQIGLNLVSFPRAMGIQDIVDYCGGGDAI